MIDSFTIRRSWLISFFLFVFLSSHSVYGQDTPDSQEVACLHAGSITLKNANALDTKGIWASETSNQDGLLSLTYCGVYKNGPTIITRIPALELKGLPKGFDGHRKYADLVGEKIDVKTLPVGFTVYRDMAFEIRTEAVPDDRYLTFKLPSVRTEEEFKNLMVLYLDESEFVPGALQWQGYRLPFDIPKSDFKTRTLTSAFDFISLFHHNSYVGRVIVGAFNQAEYDKSSVDVGISSLVGPAYVKFGETFTYTVTIFSGAINSITATDVAFNSTINGASFVGVNSNMGKCRKSVNSDPVVVCEFEKLAPRATAMVYITVKADDKSAIGGDSEFALITMNIVSAKQKDPIPENNVYESRSTVIRR